MNVAELQDRINADLKVLEFDLSAPALSIAQSDRYAFAINGAAKLCAECDFRDERYCPMHFEPAMVVARCTRTAIGQTVNAFYKGEMDRTDAQYWAHWLAVLEAVDEHAGRTYTERARVAVTTGQVKWLRRIVAKEDLRVRTGLVQWREALLVYIDTLLGEKS